MLEKIPRQRKPRRKWRSRARTRTSGVFAHDLFSNEAATDPFDDEIRAVQQSPNHKRPGRAMPKAAQEHDNDKIERGTIRTDLISAERNVKVIAQEGGKRDVPAPPKIREADGGVGKTEIVL